MPLAALARQLSARNLRITSTVVGIAHHERIARPLDLCPTPIPEAFWARVAETAS